MPGSTVSLTSRKPAPPQADFAIYIDFVRGEGSPSRVFLAAQEFIKACETLDHALCGVIDSNIEPVMVLEEIETGSLKIWLRNVLKSADDDGIKKLDWKPLIGKYLVRSKYLVLKWIDEDQATPKSLPQLAKQIQKLAEETDVKHLPDYSRPRPQDLVAALEKFQTAKNSLLPGDKAKYVSSEGDVEFNLSIRMDVESFAELAVGSTIESPPTPMILAVKRPDYLGESQWEFRHGKSGIKAKIEDVSWLALFKSRQVDIRPGDALRCIVVISSMYGFDNELIGQKYLITKVEEVLVDKYKQTEMFDDKDGV
jgi:hypothetical protein